MVNYGTFYQTERYTNINKLFTGDNNIALNYPPNAKIASLIYLKTLVNRIDLEVSDSISTTSNTDTKLVNMGKLVLKSDSESNLGDSGQGCTIENFGIIQIEGTCSLYDELTNYGVIIGGELLVRSKNTIGKLKLKNPITSERIEGFVPGITLLETLKIMDYGSVIFAEIPSVYVEFF